MMKLTNGFFSFAKWRTRIKIARMGARVWETNKFYFMSLLYTVGPKTLNCSSLPQSRLSIYGKDKAVRIQAWKGPEDSRRLRLPDFKTVDIWRW
jgi:hypothetical protein